MAGDPILTRGEQVPHFVVRGLDGESIAYSTIWQQRNLLLLSLPDHEAEGKPYVERLNRALAGLTPQDTAYVFTTSEVPGVPRPGMVVADKWGEIHYVVRADTVAQLPGSDEIVDWLRYVQMQCPECQGETK